MGEVVPISVLYIYELPPKLILILTGVSDYRSISYYIYWLDFYVLIV